MQQQSNTKIVPSCSMRKELIASLAIMLVPPATALIIAYNVLPEENFLPSNIATMLIIIAGYNVISVFINVKVQKWLAKRKQLK